MADPTKPAPRVDAATLGEMHVVATEAMHAGFDRVMVQPFVVLALIEEAQSARAARAKLATVEKQRDELLAERATVLARWEAMCARKAELVEKKVARTATDDELAELQHLKAMTSAVGALVAPLPIAELEAVAERIRKEAARGV